MAVTGAMPKSVLSYLMCQREIRIRLLVTRDLIVRLSSIAVPYAQLSVYRSEVLDRSLPIYESAGGLVSVALLQRDLAGYAELVMISLWRSESAMLRFIETHPNTKEMENELGVIQI